MVVPPNHPFLVGFSIINHPFWGTPILGNTHIVSPQMMLGRLLFIRGHLFIFEGVVP